jgi:Flp pilus assembly protein TadD
VALGIGLLRLAKSSWSGVGKPKQSAGGFSSSKPAAAPNQEIAKSSADRVAKEQQALALINQGKLQEAEAIYSDLIETGTRNHIVYGNLAAICGMQGRFDELIELLNKALQLNPNNPEVHNNLGNALKQQGDLTAAIASYDTALQLKPNNPEVLNNLGNAHQEQGELTAAISCFHTALQLKPNYPEVHYNLGIALKEQGELAAAIACFNTALQLKPNNPEVLNNLGNALQDQGELAAAIACFNTALQLKPTYPEVHYNLGIALKDQDELAAAIACFNTALQLKPNFPEVHNNLGNALQEQGELTSAKASYNTALQLKPNYPEAHKNLSMAELLIGDYGSGWQRYEYRFQCKKDQLILNANPSCGRWCGEKLSQRNKLLLVSEQGLGDTLQFMRYANSLKNQGLLVSVCAPRKLHTLIQISGIDSLPLTFDQASQVTEGYWIPLLSVPKHLGVSPENPVSNEPYIKTKNELRTKWEKILSVERRPLIGINWQGNPAHEKTNSNGRSLPLEAFAPIAASTNAGLLSLQKGFGSEQLDTCSFKDRFVCCQDQINDAWDFLETAAIIANCDLVITSDTSVAHLAGGMGKTTWLLLKKIPEWRWGLAGHTTFWYPSMRLFRQRERGNWNEVMERVAEALQAYFGDSSAHTQPANL